MKKIPLKLILMIVGGVVLGLGIGVGIFGGGDDMSLSEISK